MPGDRLGALIETPPVDLERARPLRRQIPVRLPSTTLEPVSLASGSGTFALLGGRDQADQALTVALTDTRDAKTPVARREEE